VQRISRPFDGAAAAARAGVALEEGQALRCN
jgi:hypothetical protein